MNACLGEVSKGLEELQGQEEDLAEEWGQQGFLDQQAVLCRPQVLRQSSELAEEAELQQ
jgi:hypothetical protein